MMPANPGPGDSQYYPDKRSAGSPTMAYGHAERTLAAIRKLDAETTQLLCTMTQLDLEQSAWLKETASPGE
jgi:hypothetical protein